VIEGGYETCIEVGNAMINMYSKCGAVGDARKVFDGLTDKSVVSWTSMLDAYSSHGYGKEALRVFRHMQQDGVKPDEVTFVSVLTACSHAGLLHEAREAFFSMSLDHGIAPKPSHCACMIDMFARVGRLDEAERFLCNMPFKCGVVEWMALLGACRSRGDVQRAERAAEQILALDPRCSGAYINLWSIYTDDDRVDDAARLKARMIHHGVDINLDRKPTCGKS
jgi:pentatricopeptide repeat protein